MGRNRIGSETLSADYGASVILWAALRNNQGNHEEALWRGGRALAAFQAHDDQWGTAVTHYELGRALTGLGRLGEAATAYRTAIRGLEDVGEWQRLAEATAAFAEISGRSRRR